MHSSPSSSPSRVKHYLISAFVGSLYRLSRLFRRLRKRRVPGETTHVLLTGRFHSDAWIKAFLRPLAAATRGGEVCIVATFEVDEEPGIRVVYPPERLQRLLGESAARLLMFAWVAWRTKPDLVGGFHISINALWADLVASLAGARSMYVCVGGPIEIIDGGVWGESRFFAALGGADPAIEARLLRTVRSMDAIVPMGESARKWLVEHGVASNKVQIVTGAVDLRQFDDMDVPRDVDVLFVGRLVPIKEVHLLLEAIALLKRDAMEIRARIVGTGPLEAELEARAAELGISENVEFAGFVPSVAAEYARARCFLLTSRSEGLSLALLEAMSGGAVPVVADVGDLGDVVHHGQNGLLVNPRDAAHFAKSIKEVLADEAKLGEFSRAAKATGTSYGVEAVSSRWDRLLGETLAR